MIAHELISSYAKNVWLHKMMIVAGFTVNVVGLSTRILLFYVMVSK